MNKLLLAGYGYRPISEGRTNFFWKYKGKYTDEIYICNDFNRVKYRASRFRTDDDEIIKEDIFECLQDAIKFLE